MAIRSQRPQIAACLYFEAVLQANEVLVIPLNRSASRNGDSQIAIQAKAGTKVASAIAHPQTVAAAIPQGQSYVSTVNGDYPLVANCDAFAHWNADTTIAVDWDTLSYGKMATALRIIAPAGGTHLIIYGDY